MKHQLLMVDMDGTIAEFLGGLRRVWATSVGTVCPLPPPEQHTIWDLYAVVPKEHHETFDQVMATPGLFRDLEPIKGAVDALHAMRQAGHEVMLCSTPLVTNKGCVEEKLDWIERHLGDAFTKKAIFTHDKTVVCGDILVDDKPVIRGARMPTWSHVVYHQPYNAHITDRPRLHSWADWRSLLTI